MVPSVRLRRALILALPLILVNPARADSPGTAEQRIVELYETGKLFDTKRHKEVTAAFGDLFEEKRADTIRRAYGGDYEELAAWLHAHPAIRNTFYTALDERQDKLPRA